MSSPNSEVRDQVLPEGNKRANGGQDALNEAPQFDIRQGEAFIDDLEVEDFGSDYTAEDDDQSGYDSQLEEQAWANSITRVDDEDWEIAEAGNMLTSYAFTVAQLI